MRLKKIKEEITQTVKNFLSHQTDKSLSVGANSFHFCHTASDGKEYVIGTEISSQALLASVDVCTPSIIVINLCHNTSFDNYKTKIGEIVRILRNELPETKIVLMTIDEAGTLFPQDYPNYISSDLLYTDLHEKNSRIYRCHCKNVVRGS